jgi:hypothetical protein
MRGALGWRRPRGGEKEKWASLLFFPFFYFSLPFYSYSNLNIVFEPNIQIYLMSLN